jgi:hypothetical protein
VARRKSIYSMPTGKIYMKATYEQGIFYLGRVWESSTQLQIHKNSSTPFFSAKHPSSKNSRSTKSMDLAPNSTKFMEYLKGYSAKAGFVLTRGVD